MGSAAPPLPDEVVLDTSVLVAWAFRETGRYPRAQDILSDVVSGDVQAYVPELFWAEFQQVAGHKRHRDRHARDGLGWALGDVEAAYADVVALPLDEIAVLGDLRQEAWDLRRAREVGSYDAYFVAFAAHFGLELWTFDGRLCSDLAPDPALRSRVREVGVDVMW